MRVPLIKNDLPVKFNKVSKYLGRHWPNEKLGLNKSCETLAYLFGYNSMHEVNKVSASTNLPPRILLEPIYESMVGKALFKYGIRPDIANDLFFRLPLKELAFYDITDKAIESRWAAERMKEGRFFFVDEMTEMNNYKSPELIIEQSKSKVLPPYTYAVDKSGNVFSSSTYETMLNQLGDLDNLVDELDVDITVPQFIAQYVTPLAWRPLEEWVEYKNYGGKTEWNLPYFVVIYHIRNNEGNLGFILFNQGVNAYYPVIFDSLNGVTNALISIFNGQSFTADQQLNQTYELLYSTSSELSGADYEHWRSVDFTKAEVIKTYGQEFIRAKVFKAYPELTNNTYLTTLDWAREVKQEIDSSVMSKEIYQDHCAIKASLKPLFEATKLQLDNFEPSVIESFYQLMFEGAILTLETVIHCEYGNEYELSEEDEIEWERVGQEVIQFHPELKSFFEVAALGKIFIDYKEYIDDLRYTSSCYERELGLFGYLLSYVPRLKSSASTFDLTFAGTIVLAGCLEGLNYDKTSITKDYLEITSMLVLHASQNSDIKSIIKYAEYISKTNPDFVTHGTPSHYQEKSSSEVMQEILRANRKFNVSLADVTQT